MCLLRDLVKILGNNEGRGLVTGRYSQSIRCKKTLHILNSEIDGRTCDGLYSLKV